MVTAVKMPTEALEECARFCLHDRPAQVRFTHGGWAALSAQLILSWEDEAGRRAWATPPDTEDPLGVWIRDAMEAFRHHRGVNATFLGGLRGELEELCVEVLSTPADGLLAPELRASALILHARLQLRATQRLDPALPWVAWSTPCSGLARALGCSMEDSAAALSDVVRLALMAPQLDPVPEITTLSPPLATAELVWFQRCGLERVGAASLRELIAALYAHARPEQRGQLAEALRQAEAPRELGRRVAMSDGLVRVFSALGAQSGAKFAEVPDALLHVFRALGTPGARVLLWGVIDASAKQDRRRVLALRALGTCGMTPDISRLELLGSLMPKHRVLTARLVAQIREREEREAGMRGALSIGAATTLDGGLSLSDPATEGALSVSDHPVLVAPPEGALVRHERRDATAVMLAVASLLVVSLVIALVLLL